MLRLLPGISFLPVSLSPPSLFPSARLSVSLSSLSVCLSSPFLSVRLSILSLSVCLSPPFLSACPSLFPPSLSPLFLSARQSLFPSSCLSVSPLSLSQPICIPLSVSSVSARLSACLSLFSLFVWIRLYPLSLSCRQSARLSLPPSCLSPPPSVSLTLT